MASYKIEIKRSAQKEIEALPKKEVSKIVKAISLLAKEPRGVNSKKLSGQERYRLRVGRYRVLYEIRDQVLLITVVKVAHRKQVYR